MNSTYFQKKYQNMQTEKEKLLFWVLLQYGNMKDPYSMTSLATRSDTVVKNKTNYLSLKYHSAGYSVRKLRTSRARISIVKKNTHIQMQSLSFGLALQIRVPCEKVRLKIARVANQIEQRYIQLNVHTQSIFINRFPLTSETRPLRVICKHLCALKRNWKIENIRTRKAKKL